MKLYQTLFISTVVISNEIISKVVISNDRVPFEQYKQKLAFLQYSLLLSCTF